MSNYKEQLRNPRWQRKRLEVFDRDGWKCRYCGDSETELHAHHTYYASGKKAWEYPSSDIITLCSMCHKNIHDCENAIGIVVPWVYYNSVGNDHFGMYDIFLLEKIYDDRIWIIRTRDGEDLHTGPGEAAMILSEGKKGADWIMWALRFREEVIMQREQD